MSLQPEPARRRPGPGARTGRAPWRRRPRRRGAGPGRRTRRGSRPRVRRWCGWAVRWPCPPTGRWPRVALGPGRRRRAVRPVRRGDFDVVAPARALGPGPGYACLVACRAAQGGDVPPRRGERRLPAARARGAVGRGSTRRRAAPCRPRPRPPPPTPWAGRYEIIGNGVDLDRFAQAEPWPTDGPTVLFVGRHERARVSGSCSRPSHRSPARRRRGDVVGGRARVPTRPCSEHARRPAPGWSGWAVSTTTSWRPGSPVPTCCARPRSGRVLRRGPARGHGGADRRGGERHPRVSIRGRRPRACSCRPATRPLWPVPWPRPWPTPPPAQGGRPRPPSTPPSPTPRRGRWPGWRSATSGSTSAHAGRCRHQAELRAPRPTLPPWPVPPVRPVRPRVAAAAVPRRRAISAPVRRAGARRRGRIGRTGREVVVAPAGRDGGRTGRQLPQPQWRRPGRGRTRWVDTAAADATGRDPGGRTGPVAAAGVLGPRREQPCSPRSSNRWSRWSREPAPSRRGRAGTAATGDAGLLSPRCPVWSWASWWRSSVSSSPGRAGAVAGVAVGILLVGRRLAGRDTCARAGPARRGCRRGRVRPRLQSGRRTVRHHGSRPSHRVRGGR